MDVAVRSSEVHCSAVVIVCNRQVLTLCSLRIVTHMQTTQPLRYLFSCLINVWRPCSGSNTHEYTHACLTCGAKTTQSNIQTTQCFASEVALH